MNNRMKNIKNMCIGLIAGILLTSITPIIADSIQQNIEVVLNNVNIKINNETLANKNENFVLANGEKVPYSILYKGTTYLPMRVVAESIGKEVQWDGSTGTAVINNKSNSVNINESEVKNTEINSDLTYEEFKNLWEFKEDNITESKAGCQKIFLYKGISIKELSKIDEKLLKEYSISFYNELFANTEYVAKTLRLSYIDSKNKESLAISIRNMDPSTGEATSELWYQCFVYVL